MLGIPQSATLRVPLQAYLSSDHITPATTKTIAVTISKNGAAYANPSGGATNATEIANGSYYVDLSTTDTGTKGPLFVRGSASGTDDVIAIYNVVDPNNGGLAALPATACTSNASLITSGTGTAQLSVSSGQVTVGTNSDKTGYALSGTQTFNVTGNITGNLSGSVGSVTGAVGSVTGAVASVTGNVGGNVTGSVGSISGVTFPTNFGSTVISSSGYVSANQVQALGVAIYGYDVALTDSSTSTQIQFGTTDAAGNAIPDDGRFAGCTVQVVAGTGINQLIALGAAVGGHSRTYAVISGTMPVTCDHTSQVIFLNSNNGVTASLNLSTPLGSPRALDTVADSSVTIQDAFWAAVCGAAGKEAVSGTTYLVKTPFTGTVIRTFTLDQNPGPNSRS